MVGILGLSTHETGPIARAMAARLATTELVVVDPPPETQPTPEMVLREITQPSGCATTEDFRYYVEKKPRQDFKHGWHRDR